MWTLLVYCHNQSEAVLAAQDTLLGCPFISDTEQSQTLELWAYTLPVCLLLACNFVFSIWIMAVSQTSHFVYCLLKFLSPSLMSTD